MIVENHSNIEITEKPFNLEEIIYLRQNSTIVD